MWTPEKIAEARELWASGLKAESIGRRMGVSKNSIIGIANRNAFSRRARRDMSAVDDKVFLLCRKHHGRDALPFRTMAKMLNLTESQAKGAIDRLERAGRLRTAHRRNDRTVVEVEGVKDDSHLREPRGCRYIIGDVRSDDWRYCQEPQIPESSYCREHHRRTHLPARSMSGWRKPPE